MRLTRKLSLAIGLGICLVLGIHAWIRVGADSEQYRNDVRRDHDVTGRSLASTVELLWRTDGETRAREVIEELNLRESHVQIRWVWPRALPGDDNAALRPDLIPTTGGRTHSEVVTGEDGEPYMLSYTLFDLPGDDDGAIELYESLANEQTHIVASLRRTAITTTALIVVCVMLTLGFGIFFVARPLRLLADQARRIGEGDLDHPIEIRQDDEIQEVARAMNHMCERLREARVHLERETAAKMRALEQLRHADRLRMIGQLSSVIAHELGSPLNVVRARGAMIAEGDLPPPRVRELGEQIVEQTDRMERIIRGLLDFARRDPPTRHPVALAHPVREAIQWLQPIAAKRNVTISFDEGQEHLQSPIDLRQIQQAVTNLLVNALDASPDGATIAVRIRPGPGDEEISIEVRDRGAGIAVEQIPLIFEPFFTTKPSGQGTGLGLAIADEIVREHGGAIDCESRPGDGALFRIRLPRTAEGIVEAARREASGLSPPPA
jgi:signal transduction histidine kinase